MEIFSLCTATVIGAVIVMIYGLKKIFERLEAKQQGFGPNTLKAIGVILFLPTLLILAVLTEFKTETLAALLGTVAGYVLSNSKPEKKTHNPSAQKTSIPTNDKESS
jgi:xanthine/uracil permease